MEYIPADVVILPAKLKVPGLPGGESFAELIIGKLRTLELAELAYHGIEIPLYLRKTAHPPLRLEHSRSYERHAAGISPDKLPGAVGAYRRGWILPYDTHRLFNAVDFEPLRFPEAFDNTRGLVVQRGNPDDKSAVIRDCEN